MRMPTPATPNLPALRPGATGPDPRPSAPLWRLALVGLLFGAGVLLWFFLEGHGSAFWSRRGRADFRNTQLLWAGAVAAATALLALIPPAGRRVESAYDRLRSPGPRTRLVVALLVALCAGAYLLFTALRQGRELTLRMHDENMYLVQAQMLAHGRLWRAAHPLADFFEAFHIFTKPVYAAMYFPGTALAYAPAVRLGAPTWWLSLAIASAAAGMTYRVVAELLDGVAGVLAALLLLTVGHFRWLAVMVMSHPLVLLLGLGMFWAWLRWRAASAYTAATSAAPDPGRPAPRARAARWALLIGLFAGWAAITRPLDAACYALPMGLALLLDLRRLPRRAAARTLGLIALAAAPFLALQIVQNVGVTGHALRTPVQHYVAAYWPELGMGLRAKPVPGHRPPSDLLQFQAFYFKFVLPQVRAYETQPVAYLLGYERLQLLLHALVVPRLLVVLLPLGLLGLTDRRRAAFASVVALFFAAYGAFMYFLPHYTVVVAPMAVFTLLAGARALEDALAPWRRFVGPCLASTVLALAVLALPEFTPQRPDASQPMPVLRDVNRRLAALPHEPAVVLFRYHPEVPLLWEQEPVYTIDAPWPDDAAVVRAHDLGEKQNRRIFDYYARVQPGRFFYRYDLKSRELTELGPATSLVAPNP